MEIEKKFQYFTYEFFNQIQNILGMDALKIASLIIKKFEKENAEIKEIMWEGSSINVKFKPSVSEKRKKEILIKLTKSLSNAFRPLIGNVVDKLIENIQGRITRTF